MYLTGQGVFFRIVQSLDNRVLREFMQLETNEQKAILPCLILHTLSDKRSTYTVISALYTAASTLFYNSIKMNSSS